MLPFWDCLIEPVLQRLNPEVVVEIGAEEGQTTKVLVDFCRREKALLHSIDPAPRFDVSHWVEQAAGRLVFHQKRSLLALPIISPYHAVLVDGDHNWYTVFHEMKVIEHCCLLREQPFPLMFVHDVGWPYGRRDMYYDPSAIPAEYRQPCARKGIQPGISQLANWGFNAHLWNAVTENTPRNGVLSAIEDFLRETQHTLELILVPGFAGLGLLVPAWVQEQNPTLDEFLEAWRLPRAVFQYLDRLETARLRLAVLQQLQRQGEPRAAAEQPEPTLGFSEFIA